MRMSKVLGWLFMAASLSLSTNVQAQALKQFTLEDLNFGGNNYHNMVPKNRWYTWWGDKLVRQDIDNCYLVDTKTGKEKVLFSLQEIQKAASICVPTINVRSLYYVSFPFADKPLALISDSEQRTFYDFKKKEITWMQPSKSQTFADFNAESRAVIYVKDNQLCVRYSDKEQQLTTDGSADIVYGQSVHRDEFGYSKGTFWSPDGQKVAFTRMDQSMVTAYPLVDIPEADWKPEKGSRIAQPAPTKYPMAGETSHKVTIGIYDLQTGTTVYLKAGNPTDRYFTNLAWSPDSKTVYLFELNRDQNDCRLVSYDAATGSQLKELYRETDEKYVEPLHPIVFLPWDSNKFILQSQKDGFNHLYLLNKDGKELKQLTKGPWVVMNMLGFDKKHHGIIFESNELNPIQKNIFALNVDNGKRTLLDENGQGWHDGELSASGELLIDRYQTPTTPRNITLVSSGKGKPVRLFTADNPWAGYAVPTYECGTIKAADGMTNLYYRMVKPVNFSPDKKYPTIIYVYGGPHAHNVDARWNYCSRGWETYMAQKGYLLFILDNRGSENRGKAFEQATFRHLGEEEMKDQMEGVKFLKSLPYVDADRMGVHGWSFGGFMTTNLMTTYPDVFKVGVAGGPVIDWKWYEVMYGERYMDTPQANPEGYKNSSLIPKAKNLKGKLQVIIGLNDPVVLPQHAFSFIHQCILDGTQPDFFVYPGEPHNMRGHQSTHLHERISQYFDDYLK